MNEIIEKLKKIALEILREKTSLKFFGLFRRMDLEEKWDILLSADWLSDKKEDDLVYVINKLNREFPDNLDFLAQIALLKPSEDFIKKLLVRINGSGDIEFRDFKLDDSSTLNKFYVVHKG